MNIDTVFELAIVQRPKLRDAIGFGKPADIDGVPKQLKPIYEVALGTASSVSDQTLMDIVPGYRLIHRNELDQESVNLSKNLSAKEVEYLPFLANYSSCFVALSLKDAGVYQITPDALPERLAETLEKYWDTIMSFYNDGVYLLDSDGYLDYNFEQEGEVGARLNPTCQYWSS